MSGTVIRPRIAAGARSDVMRRLSLPILGGLLAGSLVLGYGVSAHPLATLSAVLLVLIFITWAIVGTESFTVLALAALPWLVLLIDLTPRLTLTLSSSLVVLLLLWRTPFPSHYSWTLRAGLGLFGISLLGQAVLWSGGSELAEAAKYLLFPAMALVVLNRFNQDRLASARVTLIWSGVAAMVVQGAAILLHVTQPGAYYGAGEKLGLAAKSPHELALIGVMVAVACLLTVKDKRWRVVGAIVAATPALATGVRSALVALVLSLIILAIRAKFRPSVIAAIAAVSIAIIASGAGTIVVNRYEEGQARGEYSSFAKAGSGRGAVWEADLRKWLSSGTGIVTFGAGLRAVQKISVAEFGAEGTAQSDLVTTLVEFGIVGFLGWLLIWIALLRASVNWLVLLPLAVYAVTNGSLEYVGAVVFGFALAAACGSVRFSFQPSRSTVSTPRHA